MPLGARRLRIRQLRDETDTVHAMALSFEGVQEELPAQIGQNHWYSGVK